MSRLIHLYLLCLKSEAFEFYKQYEAWCMTHLGVTIKVLHSNQGGEYLDKGWILYLKSRGTEQKLTVHDTPAHNGVAECCNQTIVEQIHTLLHASSLPKFLWGEAVRHVVWLMNTWAPRPWMEKPHLRLPLERNLTLEMSGSGVRLCGYELREVISLEGMSTKVIGLTIQGCTHLLAWHL